MNPPRVLVTGGGRGIGRAIALRFARAGSRVVVAARTSTELDAVAAEIDAAGGKGLAAQLNVRDQGSVTAAMWRVVEFTHGALDLLVNNAGIFEIKRFDDTDADSWNRMLEVNLSGAFYVTHEALDALEEGDRPHIVNIASIAARQGFEGNVAYCASKYGLRGFGDALRVELAPLGVRVTTLYPGNVDTDIWKRVPGNWDRSKMAKPEVVAEAVWNAYHAPDGADVADLDVPGATSGV